MRSIGGRDNSEMKERIWGIGACEKAAGGGGREGIRRMEKNRSDKGKGRETQRAQMN